MALVVTRIPGWKRDDAEVVAIEPTTKSRAGGFMHKPAATIDALSSFVEPRVRNRRFRKQLKPQAPKEIEELAHKFQKQRYNFEQTIECPSCGRNKLHLQKLDFEWPYGTSSVTFPGILAYRCESCEETFFPEEELSEMAQVMDVAVKDLTIERPRHNPRALAFAKNYRQR